MVFMFHSLGPVPPAPPLQMGDGALVVPAASVRVSDEEADEDNEWASQEWDGEYPRKCHLPGWSGVQKVVLESGPVSL